MLRLCTGRLTLAAGQADLIGRRDLLKLCLTPSGGIDYDKLANAAPDPGSFIPWAALVGVIDGQVNETFEDPLPESLGSYEVVRNDFAVLSWVIPLLDAQLQSQSIPPAVRQSILAVAVPILSQPTCRLTATVGVELNRVGVEDLSLRWSTTTDGRPHLRFNGPLDADRTVATYRIDPEYRCLGSTNNILHPILRAIFASRDNRVLVPDGSVRLNILLSPLNGRIGGTPEVNVDLRQIDIPKPYGWIPDGVWQDMLADFGVTGDAVEAKVEPPVTRALGGLATRVADALTDNLQLDPDERVRMIEVDDASPRNLLVFTRYANCFVLPGSSICLPPPPRFPSL